MSIKEFCKTSGFHENVYYYWQRKLREAACEELTVRGQKEAVPCETPLIPNGWAICKSGEQEINGKAVAIEIGGLRVIAEAESDPEILVKVCRALKSLC
jgi:hypothetical protein